MQIPFMKQCSKCKETKSVLCFNNNRRYADGYLSWCKDCMRAYQKQWVIPHKQERKEKAQKFYLDNKSAINERNNARCRERWASDPEYRERKNKQKKESIARDSNHAEKSRVWKNAWNALHRDDPKVKESHHKAVRKAHHKRRAAIHSNGETLTIDPDEWDALCAKYDNRCLACGAKKKLEQDHIVPISKGGSNSISNVQPLCRSCNSKKYTKIIDYR